MTRGRRLLGVAAAAALCAGNGLVGEVVAQERTTSPDPAARFVVGVVVDHGTGEPLAAALVFIGGGPLGQRERGARLTDEQGRFDFGEVPAGTYPLRVARQGYRTMSASITVTAGVTLDLVLPLSTQAILLEPIIVTAERSLSEVRSAAARRTSGAGFVVTRAEIEERRPRLISDMLHRVPGGMVVPSPPFGYQLLLRSQCQPGIWVDGVELPGAEGIDQLLTPGDVEIVEVYHGLELPVELGVNACGGVVAWTRRGGRNVRAQGADTGFGLVGSLIVATALAALALAATR